MKCLNKYSHLETQKLLEKEQNNHAQTQTALANEKSTVARWHNNYNSENNRAKNLASALESCQNEVIECESTIHGLRISGSHEDCVRRRSVEKLLESFRRTVQRSRTVAGTPVNVPVPDALKRGASDGKLYMQPYEPE
jgi:hypothetical protein